MHETQLARRVLIADDDAGIQALLRETCETAGLETLGVTDGEAAVREVGRWKPDLILMDAMMPALDGFRLTESIRSMPAHEHIPIIMLTGLKSHEDKMRGIRAGASDFLTKPVDSEELLLRLRNHLKVKEYGDYLANHSKILEREIAERTEHIREGHIETIYRLAVVSEYKDEDTGAHIRRISHYARELAEVLGMDGEFTETIYHAASMHDIGKVGIPDVIMGKSGPLDEQEWAVMRSHTTLGAQILVGSTSPFLTMGEEIARSHHERWDGSGYPLGLSGEAIPLTARIVAIADQYDALRSTRPYKRAMSHQEAVDIIMRGDGRSMPGHFDPDVHAAFGRSVARMAEIFREVSDPDWAYASEEGRPPLCVAAAGFAP